MNPQVKVRKKLAATEARNLRTLLLLSVFEPQDIGARIATARKEAGLTQEELADLVGVSTRSLQGYESGEVVPYRHMGKLAEVTTRPVGWFLHGDEETPGAATAPSILDSPEFRQLLREELSALLEPLEQLLERLAGQEPPGANEAGNARP